jgi:carbamoyl-phosphate synthase L subunit-like protein
MAFATRASFGRTRVTTTALLVSTATRWIGTARIPAALAQAGFTVALLTPRNSLAEKSRHVASVAYLPDDATITQWAASLAASVEAVAPTIVLPCDDMAFRLLARLARAAPPEMPASLHSRLSSLVAYSLGDPAHHDASVDKTRFPDAAQALGVSVPPFAIVDTLAAAESFARASGYPVVLKRAHGFAGAGVAVCADLNEIARAFAKFREPQALDLGDSSSRLLVQAHVPGTVRYYLSTAWRGQLIAGYASEKVVAHPHPTGPPTVTRHFRSPQLRAAAAALAAGFGITGHFFVEFIVPANSDDALVLEINRRITPGSHRGSLRNVDHWAALYAAITETRCHSRSDFDDGEEGYVVWFPEEWLRDPESRHLREHVVDVPWDEPELIEALAAMRSER